MRLAGSKPCCIIKNKDGGREMESRMVEIRNDLIKITRGCREDMHEPDEQEIHAIVHGKILDNAFGNDLKHNEINIIIERGTKECEVFNLADLIALARKAK
jgi:hypothetical protein